MKLTVRSLRSKAALQLTSILLAVIVPIGIDIGTAYAGVNSTYSDAWGTQEVASTDWLGGTGVPIYSNLA